MNNETEQLLVVALKRLKALKLQKCMDANDLESRPYQKQQEILDAINDYAVRAVVAGNQTGKTALGGRECAWIFNREHPTYTPPPYPLKLVVIGRVGEQVESEIWRNKIKPFLNIGTYKEIRIGNILQRVEHDNGNIIIFMSHHNIKDAREKAQGHVADWVWIDEMVSSVDFITETAVRCQAHGGKMLLTFTPLLRSQEVKKWILGLEAPFGKVFTLFMLDNPIYKGREDEILARFKNIPEASRRARLFGEWYAGELAVYDYDDAVHVANPTEYHPAWRHVLSVDPAASGKAGVVLLAEDPSTAQWFVIKEAYIKGAAASDLLPKVEKLAQGVNLIRRISDPHEPWFIKEASKRGITYIGVHKKNDRKAELIKNLQEALNSGKLRIATWCILLPEELTTCQWSETTKNKIVGSSRFHLLDSVQYAIDNLPPPSKVPIARSFDEALRHANRQRRQKEATRPASGGRIRPKVWARQGKRII